MDKFVIPYQTETSASTNDSEGLLDSLASIDIFGKAQLEDVGQALEEKWHSDGQALATTEADLRQCISAVVKEQDALGEKRRHGWHKGAASFQQFAACLSEVLDNYGPVADTLQDGGVPFAKLGFQVLASLLLLPRIETAVEAALYVATLYVQVKQIRDAFPRFQVLKRVCRDRPELRNPFVQMHRGIVVWAAEAADFYGSRWARFKSVVSGSPTEGSFARLMDVLLQISKWTNTLIHENIDGLQRQAETNERQLLSVRDQIGIQTSKLDVVTVQLREERSQLELVQAQLRETSSKLDEQSSKLEDLREQSRHTEIELAKLRQQESDEHRQRDEDRYEDFEEALRGQRHIASTQNIAQLSADICRSLRYRLNKHTGFFKTYAWTAKELADQSDFREWRSETASKMLLLGTDEPPKKTGYSWISSGPVDFAREHEGREGEASGVQVALYSCHPEPWAQDASPDFVDIVADVALQIVRKDKALLRNKDVRGMDAGTLERWRKDWSKDETDRLVGYAIRLFDLASRHGPLHLVVDRLDACRDFDGAPTELLKAFERLAQGASNTKILITLLLQKHSHVDICQSHLDSRDIIVGDLSLKSSRKD